VACAFCDSFAWLVVLRLLTGVGLGGAVPNAVALGAEYARRGSKATIIGALFVGYALGGASPGWIAGWLLPILGWPSVLLVGGVPALLAVCLIATSLPESIGFLAADGRRRGELFRMLDRYHPGHGVPPDANIIAPESVRHGLPLRLLFTDGRALTTLLLWFSFVTTIAGLFFTITWTPTLVASMGLTGSHAAMILAVFLTSGALGCLLVTRVIDKVGVAGLIVCQLLAAAIVFTMGQVGTSSELLLALIAAFGGVFASGSQAGLNSIAGTYYPAAIRASGVGWALGIGRGGAIIAPILGGALLAAGTKPPSMFAISALLTAVSAMSMILLMVQRGSQLRDAAATVPGE